MRQWKDDASGAPVTVISCSEDRVELRTI